MTNQLSEKTSILLLSGGVDSVTTGAFLRRKGYSIHALSFDYGQRHRWELEAAARAADFLEVIEHRVVNLDLRAFGGSALTDDIEVPKDRPLDDQIPVTYVPARNTLFLSYALAFAEARGIFEIALGVNAVDYSGYPDCRPEFIQAFAEVARLGTKAGVEGQEWKILTPLIHLTKAEILREGMQLGVDYAKTHSCYDPDAEGRPCGRCDSCMIRIMAFAELGMKDPALVAAGRA